MTDSGISAIPREARAYQGRRAGLVTRSLANTIDALVIGALMTAGYAGLNGLVFALDPRHFEFTDASPLMNVTVVLGLVILYLTATWATTGRTYGNHVMGLRVVSRRGTRLALPIALLRAGLCALFPIGLLWCAGSREHRSLQDVVLRTSVIHDWSPRVQAEPPTDRVSE